MRKILLIPVLISALLCSCGKPAVELDVTAPGAYIEKVKTADTSTDGKVILKGSDEGVKSYGAENAVVESYSRDRFLDVMPEGAEYYEDLIRNRIEFVSSISNMALIHFDGDELPELMVVDGDTHYNTGYIYSIGSDGRPYLMFRFLSEYGGMRYTPYKSIFSMSYGNQGYFRTFYLQYDNGNLNIRGAVLDNGGKISDYEDVDTDGERYYVDVPYSDELKSNYALFMEPDAVRPRTYTDKGTAVDEAGYASRCLELSDGTMVSVGHGLKK